MTKKLWSATKEYIDEYVFEVEAETRDEAYDKLFAMDRNEAISHKHIDTNFRMGYSEEIEEEEDAVDKVVDCDIENIQLQI